MKLEGKQAKALAHLIGTTPGLTGLELFNVGNRRVEALTERETHRGRALSRHLIGPRGGTKKVKLLKARP